MTYRVLALSAVFVIPALFVYLVASFLLSTFDINMWYSHQRFLAVVAYLIIISNIPDDLKGPKKKELEKAAEKQEEKINEFVS